MQHALTFFMVPCVKLNSFPSFMSFSIRYYLNSDVFNPLFYDLQTSSPFRRTIQLAISLGGDTDTIASMSGAIAGAYYGIDSISQNLQNLAEGREIIDSLAMKLYNQVTN